MNTNVTATEDSIERTRGRRSVSPAQAVSPALVDEIPDEVLVERVLGGDTGAFEHLIRRHQDRLFRRARWMGLDADTSADMVQDALVKVYENLGSCRNPGQFRSWVGQILRNRCLDFLKSAARRSVPLPFTLPADGDPQGDAEQNALRSRLNEALAALPEEQRDAFLMKHAEDLPYEEMSAITGISVSALKMRVYRARETLQVYLGADFGPEKM